MMNKPNKIATVAVGFVMVGAFVLAGSAAASAAAAPGCTAGQPTRLGGPLRGYPDDRALDTVIGVQTVDDTGNTVDLNGNPRAPGYTYIQWVNPTLPAEGSDTTGTKAWGGVCMSSKVTEVFVELYPRGPDGVTDKSRYGEAAHYYQPIDVGADNQVVLRLPLRHELGGNTGYVNGYLTHNGHRIDPALITRVRAFTHGRGPECGVEGLAASGDLLGYSQSLDATYYRIEAFAGGRCGATSQTYTVYIDCTCGTNGAVITQSRTIDVVDGAGIRADLSF
jgi:hypothetical protein